MLIYESSTEWNTCSECGNHSKDPAYRVMFKNELLTEIILCRKCLRKLMEESYEALMDS